MDLRTKGFTLIELLVALAIFVILITLAIPSFTRTIQSSRADTEMGDLRRAINYARLEAIDRGTTLRLRPSAGGSVWTGELAVYDSTGTSANVLRVVPAMSSGATLTLTSGVTALDFNNLGGLAVPSTAVVISYTLGTQSRTLNVCLNGRIQLGGSCG
ncbi:MULTISPECIES: GspH/FimT family pseudopilin [Pseudomonas]|jgi:type IV fimbrial biogenesis protein FimU|uniref:Type II secretion system protein H n=1 Tax=Pseudomonas fluorescens TaxID=294 RepID=A0A5E7NUD6_PSEFL|nr:MULTISPECIES: GspH/FimT family pseudopilin [Pseudomonas]KPG92772.1 general secretion pathway protein GspH [Pseudomonas sp. RIT-PI-r]MCF5701882.1 prepilin-type N-terminal cleavage/methylation domain-containing protein [Pseudomonas syringae]MCP1486135.1 type IV fimbrial biogenesis protein FimU [Pseudomonas fluorescens]PRB46800.1 general secretion pathway protein GspH [Pseudomonas sp. MYb3]PRC32260.1 general secretion pathway protein GspH [Pseudomonas sp. MYb2]